jgi:hypothetical protein
MTRLYAMTDDKHRTMCTVDHTNKQSDAIDWNPYNYWLRLARLRKEAMQLSRDRPSQGSAPDKKKR